MFLCSNYSLIISLFFISFLTNNTDSAISEIQAPETACASGKRNNINCYSMKCNNNFKFNKEKLKCEPHQKLYTSSNMGWNSNGTERLPKCRINCINGKCIGGDICQCRPGYIIDFRDSTRSRCVPHCEQSCINAQCLGPNFCVCNTDYVQDKTDNKFKNICTKREKRSFLKFLIPETENYVGYLL